MTIDEWIVQNLDRFAAWLIVSQLIMMMVLPLEKTSFGIRIVYEVVKSHMILALLCFFISTTVLIVKRGR